PDSTCFLHHLSVHEQCRRKRNVRKENTTAIEGLVLYVFVAFWGGVCPPCRCPTCTPFGGVCVEHFTVPTIHCTKDVFVCIRRDDTGGGKQDKEEHRCLVEQFRVNLPSCS
ncbi:unnamed protein product, partial [Hapterophycus canaliculatus]